MNTVMQTCVVTGVHTDGPTVCREIRSSPCSLTRVHVYSTHTDRWVLSLTPSWFQLLCMDTFSVVKWERPLSPWQYVLPHGQAARPAAALLSRR